MELTEHTARKIWNRVLDYCRAMAPKYGDLLERCSPLSFRKGEIIARCLDASTLESFSKKRVKEEVNKILVRATANLSEKATSLSFQGSEGGILNGEHFSQRIPLDKLDSVFPGENPSLRHLRKELKLSQAKVAAALGVSTLTYANWERQQVRPKWENIERLAKLFGANLDQILGAISGGKQTFEGFSSEEEVLGEKNEPVRYEVVFTPPEDQPGWSLKPWWVKMEQRPA